QITGASPAIPGMFPNMFPLATNQVQPFSALPVLPVQAMTQQVKMNFCEMTTFNFWI
ncbi:splicing factor U2af large subunit B, partial [Trifolium medium]|nr:splicing factor U2af large subunit B [Trifolium medium]